MQSVPVRTAVELLGLERRASFGCGGCVHGHTSLYGVGTEPAARPGREQRVARLAGSLVQPGPQHLLGGAGERDGPLLAALAFASDVAAGAEDDVGAVEADQLRDSKTSLKGHYQQGPVPSAFPAVWVRSVDERGGLLCVEEAHGGFVEALGRCGQHPLDEVGVLGVVQSGVAEQGPDGGEAKVAGPGGVVPLALEVVQEGGDRLLVEVIPAEA